MSSQAFRKKTRVVYKNMDLKFIQASIKKNEICGEKYLNSPSTCKACGGKRAFDIAYRMEIQLEEHHISYFPERIVFVHRDCHVGKFSIHHGGLRPDLIKYDEGDSRKFYDQKKEKMMLQKYLGSVTA